MDKDDIWLSIVVIVRYDIITLNEFLYNLGGLRLVGTNLTVIDTDRFCLFKLSKRGRIFDRNSDSSAYEQYTFLCENLGVGLQLGHDGL